jgi:hypothetical protein
MSSVTEELVGFACFVRDTIVLHEVGSPKAAEYRRALGLVAMEILRDYADVDGADRATKHLTANQGRLI